MAMRPGPRDALLWALLVLGAPACRGTIEDSSLPAGPGDPTGGALPGGDTAAASVCRATAKPVAPAPVLVRRLTNTEYARTIADVFGSAPSLAAGLPPDVSVDGFDNNTLGLTLSTSHLQRYFEASWLVAFDIVDSADKRKKVVGCDPGGTCLDQFIDRIGRRLFRRPLADDERRDLNALGTMAAGDPDPYAAFKVVLQAMLMSPNFLDKVEIGVPDPGRPGWKRLTGYEMATRLSFLFLTTTPSDPLLDAAQRGDLDTAEGVETMARSLLADPAARGASQRFSSQWMRLGRLDGTVRDPKRYAYWSDAQKQTTIGVLKEEALRLAEDFLWKPGASVLDILTADYTYLHPTTAIIYGVPKPAGNWQRFDHLASRPRSGLITLPGILTFTSETDKVAPIRRGKFIREVLLCNPPPPPPSANDAKLDDKITGVTVREVLAQHSANGACAACHKLLDPVGFGLENYDIVGQYRQNDTGGRPLTGEGFIDGLETPAFVGAKELGQHLSTAPEASLCFVRHLYRHAYGRTEGPADACELDKVNRSFRDASMNFREALVALVKSDGFRFIGGAQ